jgi:hypothetical protein
MTLPLPISIQSTWPPDCEARFVEADKPAGGYICIPDVILVAILHAYQSKAYDLDWLGVRTWATVLLIYFARSFQRKQSSPPVLCRTGELVTRLGGASQQRVRKAVRDLQRLGLLQMLSNGDEFTVVNVPDHRKIPTLEERLCLLRVTQKKRQVPVPRRVLQFIARRPNARYGLVATMIGVMIRCLYLHGNICRSGGACKASWIADQFGMITPTVQKAFKKLKEMGWLIRYEKPHSYRQKYGNWTFINLSWTPLQTWVSRLKKDSVSSDIKKCVDIHICSSDTNRRYPTQDFDTNRRYPDSYNYLSNEIEKYQNLSTATENGINIIDFGDDARLTEIMVPSSSDIFLPPERSTAEEQLKIRKLIDQKSLQQGGHTQADDNESSKMNVTTMLCYPEIDVMRLLSGYEFLESEPQAVIPHRPERSPASLDNLSLDDLDDNQRIDEFYEDAVARGWIPRGEAHMLFVFSAADHARHFRAKNPCGLFRKIIQNNERLLISDPEEDRARIRLREYLEQKRASQLRSEM